MDIIPPVHTVEDLPAAIEAAQKNPAIRWYAIRKAVALKASNLIPEEWGAAVTASAADSTADGQETEGDEPVVAAVPAEEVALVASYYDVLDAEGPIDAILAAERFFSEEVRQRYAKQGIALPDGSFPIPDRDALRRAIQSIGRASDQSKARRHIVKRARALGATGMLPDDWSVTASVEQETSDLVRQRLELQMATLRAAPGVRV